MSDPSTSSSTRAVRGIPRIFRGRGHLYIVTVPISCACVLSVVEIWYTNLMSSHSSDLPRMKNDETIGSETIFVAGSLLPWYRAATTYSYRGRPNDDYLE